MKITVFFDCLRVSSSLGVGAPFDFGSCFAMCLVRDGLCVPAGTIFRSPMASTAGYRACELSGSVTTVWVLWVPGFGPVAVAEGVRCCVPFSRMVNVPVSLGLSV